MAGGALALADQNMHVVEGICIDLPVAGLPVVMGDVVEMVGVAEVEHFS